MFIVCKVQSFFSFRNAQWISGACSLQVAKRTFNFQTQGRMASAGCPGALIHQNNARKACRSCLGFGEGYGPQSFKQRNKLGCAQGLWWLLQLLHVTIPLAMLCRLAITPSQLFADTDLVVIYVKKYLYKEVLCVRKEGGRPCRLC